MQVTDLGCAYLSKGLASAPTLQQLVLASNQLGEDGAAAVAQALQQKTQLPQPVSF